MSRSEQDSYARNQERAQQLDARKARVRQLNDDFRRTLTGGRVVITSGVQALGPQALLRLLRQVAGFDAFTPDNDPHEEHEWGSIDLDDQRFFWKVDCYDKQLKWGSPDPADPDVTARVLTIMLAQEY